MVTTVRSKSNGTQGALVVNGAEALVFDAAGLVSGIKPGSITPAMLSGNQGGSAPAIAARAWCRFDGTLAGTNAPAAGGNVTSVTRVSAGVYDVNLTTAMQDTNYCVAVSGRIVGAQSAGVEIRELCTTTTVRVLTFNTNSGASGDASSVNVAVFR